MATIIRLLIPGAGFDISASASIFEAAFVPGPYLVSDNTQVIRAEIQGQVLPIGIAIRSVADQVALLPYRATAHLFKAAPDLFAVVKAVALLAERADEMHAEQLRSELQSHVPAAKLAMARATGLLS